MADKGLPRIFHTQRTNWEGTGSEVLADPPQIVVTDPTVTQAMPSSIAGFDAWTCGRCGLIFSPSTYGGVEGECPACGQHAAELRLADVDEIITRTLRTASANTDPVRLLAAIRRIVRG